MTLLVATQLRKPRASESFRGSSGPASPPGWSSSVAAHLGGHIIAHGSQKGASVLVSQTVGELVLPLVRGAIAATPVVSVRSRRSRVSSPFPGYTQPETTLVCSSSVAANLGGHLITHSPFTGYSNAVGHFAANGSTQAFTAMAAAPVLGVRSRRALVSSPFVTGATYTPVEGSFIGFCRGASSTLGHVLTHGSSRPFFSSEGLTFGHLLVHGVCQGSAPSELSSFGRLVADGKTTQQGGGGATQYGRKVADGRLSSASQVGSQIIGIVLVHGLASCSSQEQASTMGHFLTHGGFQAFGSSSHLDYGRLVAHGLLVDQFYSQASQAGRLVAGCQFGGSAQLEAVEYGHVIVHGVTGLQGQGLFVAILDNSASFVGWSSLRAALAGRLVTHQPFSSVGTAASSQTGRLVARGPVLLSSSESHVTSGHLEATGLLSLLSGVQMNANGGRLVHSPVVMTSSLAESVSGRLLSGCGLVLQSTMQEKLIGRLLASGALILSSSVEEASHGHLIVDASAFLSSGGMALLKATPAFLQHIVVVYSSTLAVTRTVANTLGV